MDQVYIIASIVLAGLVLLGIKWMSSPRTAVRGNRLSAFSMFTAILLVLWQNDIVTVPLLWGGMAVGGAIGCWIGLKATMIQMPQMVALLNGLGGGASALVAAAEIIDRYNSMATFNQVSSQLALIVGGVTLSGSLIAAAKLDRRMTQRPVILKGHGTISAVSLVLMALLGLITLRPGVPAVALSLLVLMLALAYGILFAIRVGGADMPITISLLNSFSGLAGAIVGFTVGDALLVAVGAIVGASGLILTQIMCRAMNRSLASVLSGVQSTVSPKKAAPQAKKPQPAPKPEPEAEEPATPGEILRAAKTVVIAPGYGMAIAQAQGHVKQLTDALEELGIEVRFAIHPVAGRMPGHMNVLLAEADVPYDRLYEMDDINPQFKDTDVAIVVGSCDVVNPAANTAEGTPIYGMPVLRVEEAKHVLVLNLDTKPGYSGVDNPLYEMPHVTLLLGDAKASLSQLLSELKGESKAAAAASEATPTSAASQEASAAAILQAARKVIIAPGYGMAIAQAQEEVKQLADVLEGQGTEVKFAIHPVAGRMPGHMNVLLAEADVPYDRLYEMDDINPEFAEADVAIVVGSCDVVNPAANTAEGTPIYGMPVLKVEEAKHVLVLNLDTKPGYSGVDNPLYEMPHVTLLLGDAKATLNGLLKELQNESAGASLAVTGTPGAEDTSLSRILQAARKVIIAPGYGMAIAQAQGHVKQLADVLEEQGTEVKFAIHPVAGRMPGHMNVLLAEADVPYDRLYEMDDINPEFADADLAIIVGSCDVVNPAANTAEGTPIYGMPVLRVEEAKHVIVCNLDTKPGYSGVDNPLYEMPHVTLLLGDAKDSLEKLLDAATAEPGETAPEPQTAPAASSELLSAQQVIIAPGYGMAIAQAQGLVKQLADALEGRGCDVKFAIHPVAGRMPGHMNVLLAEADVSYDKLWEMDDINPLFAECDVAIIVGACDVVNPAANTAEGTPIYGMPVLRVEEAKHVIVCNLDKNPGYSGVDNPLYEMPHVRLLLGDAKASLEQLLREIDG
ncbi:MAG: NAD(P)(+) transhydrogenase (Re/Si-specific) subunit beta [Bacillota bacterium]|jgi:NAD/NADP transhydrogenase beta subunit